MKKYIVKFFAIVLGIQMLLAFAFIVMLNQSKPIKEDETKTIVVKVEETKYERRLVSEYKFAIIADSYEYQFDQRGAFSECSNRELNESIKINDVLTIKYYENIWGEKKVVDARTENNVYRSFEHYNSQRAFVFVIVFFVVLEIVFIAFTAVFVVFNRKRFKIKK